MHHAEFAENTCMSVDFRVILAYYQRERFLRQQASPHSLEAASLHHVFQSFIYTA